MNEVTAVAGDTIDYSFDIGSGAKMHLVLVVKEAKKNVVTLDCVEAYAERIEQRVHRIDLKPVDNSGVV